MPLVGGYVTEETHLGRYSQIDSRENPLMEVYGKTLMRIRARCEITLFAMYHRGQPLWVRAKNAGSGTESMMLAR